MNADDGGRNHPSGDPGDHRPRVFVALDGSLASLAALRYAVSEARRREAHLHAVRVLPSATRGMAGLDEGSTYLDQVRDGVWMSFEEALGEVPRDLDVSAVALRGSPGPTLAGLADRPDDLLVLGVGAGGPLGRWRSRALVRGCVAHAVCPVLTVPLPPHLRALSRARLRRRDMERLLHGQR
jgi:nucleotide-binding universal stress UspA family protein